MSNYSDIKIAGSPALDKYLQAANTASSLTVYQRGSNYSATITNGTLAIVGRSGNINIGVT